MMKFGVHIHVVCTVVIRGIAGSVAQLCKDGHRHLNGIDPVPVVNLVSFHHGVDRSFDIFDIVCRLSGVLLVEEEIRLTGTLVVSIACHPSLSRVPKTPLMLVSPFQGVVEITLLRIDLPEVDQSFIIVSPCP